MIHKIIVNYITIGVTITISTVLFYLLVIGCAVFRFSQLSSFGEMK